MSTKEKAGIVTGGAGLAYWSLLFCLFLALSTLGLLGINSDSVLSAVKDSWELALVWHYHIEN